MSFGGMYRGATGMQALGTGMQTVSNNLANVNTVGFKAMRTNYADLISQAYYSGNNLNQVGCASRVNSLETVFTQGSFLNTNQETDYAIAGEGFFNIRHRYSGEIMYSRSGVFTKNNEGYLEDPAGNYLQGWQMSIPKPGEKAVRIGNPVDIKLNMLSIPAEATTNARLVVNLNANDKASFQYPAYGLGDLAAAKEAEAQASAARDAAAAQVWNPTGGSDVPVSVTPPSNNLTPSNKSDYNSLFIKNYNALYGTNFDPQDAANIISNTFNVIAPTSAPNRANGEMTIEEFEALQLKSSSEMEKQATAAGKNAYKNVYDTVYDSIISEIKTKPDSWKWEGDGFAAAWDATKAPPIDKTSYSFYEPVNIYDSEGNKHALMVYYQKNPHMENIWDYIVTCDPKEDARLDGNGKPLFSQKSTFAGLLQKGKLTFAGDNPSIGHGGQIKDIEAQNFDPGSSKGAYTDAPSSSGGGAMGTATIGGYYTGKGAVDPATGQHISADRTYTVTWGYKDPNTGQFLDNGPTNPPLSGMSWEDDLGNSGFIPVSSKKYPGPYVFGEGLYVTFDKGQLPLDFGAAGSSSFSVKAHSEQSSWVNSSPNADGVFDFGLTFVKDPKALEQGPPYPNDLETISQKINLDMGAKNPFGTGEWVLDEVSSTQYGGKSIKLDNQQNGYAKGSLQRTYVTENGILAGVFSNGVNRDLYQIALSRFRSPWGLRKEGDNLFSATKESGGPFTGEPKKGGAGAIVGGFLEQSTVDTATELVNMILTQRGFQANSKSITTNDTMLATAIQLKR